MPLKQADANLLAYPLAIVNQEAAIRIWHITNHAIQPEGPARAGLYWLRCMPA